MGAQVSRPVRDLGQRVIGKRHIPSLEKSKTWGTQEIGPGGRWYKTKGSRTGPLPIVEIRPCAHGAHPTLLRLVCRCFQPLIFEADLGRIMRQPGAIFWPGRRIGKDKFTTETRRAQSRPVPFFLMLFLLRVLRVSVVKSPLSVRQLLLPAKFGALASPIRPKLLLQKGETVSESRKKAASGYRP